jgi:hypothetical protein
MLCRSCPTDIQQGVTMPPIDIYRVNFAGGNLIPELDLKGFGPMEQSATVPGKIESRKQERGLHLLYNREFQDTLGENRVHLPLPERALPLPIRLFTRVTFELPKGVTARFPPGVFAEVEPWAVALRVRFGSLGAAAGVVDGAPPVTCQFHRTGVRLNIPRSLQGDGPTLVDGPLDYDQYRGIQGVRNRTGFSLEHAYCGIPSPVASQDRRHVPGSGSLSVGRKRDHRVYSHTSFSGTTAAFIKELSIVLTMTDGSFGRISARLRSFALLMNTPPGAGASAEETDPN